MTPTNPLENAESEVVFTFDFAAFHMILQQMTYIIFHEFLTIWLPIIWCQHLHPCHVTQANSHHEGTQNHCSFQAISSNFRNWFQLKISWKLKLRSTHGSQILVAWRFRNANRVVLKEATINANQISDILRLLLHYQPKKFTSFGKNKKRGSKEILGKLENWFLGILQKCEKSTPAPRPSFWEGTWVLSQAKVTQWQVFGGTLGDCHVFNQKEHTPRSTLKRYHL